MGPRRDRRRRDRLGLALDAAARGFSVVLLEAEDFAKGTSSRATKLVHGGVRYLAQGNVALVREALHERATLLANAPHLAQPLAFVMPGYSWWEARLLRHRPEDVRRAGRFARPGRHRVPVERRDARAVAHRATRGLSGGVKYWDGQFDDARLAVALARTAARKGAVVLNHCPVTSLLREGGKVHGVVARDAESAAPS